MQRFNGLQEVLAVGGLMIEKAEVRLKEVSAVMHGNGERPPASLSRRHRKDCPGGPPQHLLGCAAPERVKKAVVALRRHDDQVGVELAGRLDDRIHDRTLPL